LFDVENISFGASLVIYINIINVPPIIIIINRIYENQNLLSLWLVFFLVGLKTYQHPCTSKKGKAIPLQAWAGHEGSGSLRFPHFSKIGT